MKLFICLAFIFTISSQAETVKEDYRFELGTGQTVIVDENGSYHKTDLNTQEESPLSDYETSYNYTGMSDGMMLFLFLGGLILSFILIGIAVDKVNENLHK